MLATATPLSPPTGTDATTTKLHYTLLIISHHFAGPPNVHHTPQYECASTLYTEEHARATNLSVFRIVLIVGISYFYIIPLNKFAN